MSKIIVFHHVAYEILGTLDPLLRSSGFRINHANFERNPNARTNIDNYDGLIILGGPMNVDQVREYPNLLTEIELIKRAFENKMPVLGICLGSQLLAKALGADIKKNKKNSNHIEFYGKRLTGCPFGVNPTLIGLTFFA